MFNDKVDVRKILGVYFTLITPFGIWPLEKDNFLRRIRWFISTSTLAVMMLHVVYETYLNCEIAEYSVDFLLGVSFGLSGLMKLFCCYKHRDKLRLNVESAIKDWSSEDAIKYTCTMSRCRIRYNKIARYFMVIGTAVALTHPFRVLFSEVASIVKAKNNEEYKIERNVTMMVGRNFIFPATCSLINVSENVYWTVMLVQCYQYAICVGANLCCDAFFISIGNHLCGQFEILKQKFASFEELRNETDTRRRLGTLIARHACLLKLADLLETSFNKIVLIQMIMNLILINTAGFNFLIFLHNGNIVGVMSSASIMFFLLVHTFMYSYLGEDFNGQGEAIVLAVYDSMWYKMPANLSKDMLFVMIRSRTSVRLTAGKFFRVTRGTFVDVVKTAFSYLSVLHVVIKESHA